MRTQPWPATWLQPFGRPSEGVPRLLTYIVCEVANMCCFKSLSMWHFVIQQYKWVHLPLITYFSDQVFSYWVSLFKSLKTVDQDPELKIKEVHEVTFFKKIIKPSVHLWIFLSPLHNFFKCFWLHLLLEAGLMLLTVASLTSPKAHLLCIIFFSDSIMIFRLTLFLLVYPTCKSMLHSKHFTVNSLKVCNDPVT